MLNLAWKSRYSYIRNHIICLIKIITFCCITRWLLIFLLLNYFLLTFRRLFNIYEPMHYNYNYSYFYNLPLTLFKNHIIQIFFRWGINKNITLIYMSIYICQHFYFYPFYIKCCPFSISKSFFVISHFSHFLKIYSE